MKRNRHTAHPSLGRGKTGSTSEKGVHVAYALVNARDVGNVANVLNCMTPCGDVPRVPTLPQEAASVPIDTLAFQTAATAATREFPEATQQWLSEWHATDSTA